MENEEINLGIIKALSEAPDSMLAKSMTDKLKEINEDMTQKEVADRLLYVIDMSVHGSLAADMVITALNCEWENVGGVIEEGNANCLWRND